MLNGYFRLQYIARGSRYKIYTEMCILTVVNRLMGGLLPHGFAYFIIFVIIISSIIGWFHCYLLLMPSWELMDSSFFMNFIVSTRTTSA